MDMTPADTDSWLERYRRAWEDVTDGVVELFTEDAAYRSNIFAEPDRGHDGGSLVSGTGDRHPVRRVGAYG